MREKEEYKAHNREACVSARVMRVTPPVEGGGAPSNTGKTDYELLVVRGPDGKFLPGTRPGPGVPTHGRRAAIAILDEMLAETPNRQRLHEALQADFDENPMRFFRRIIMPLLPKTGLLSVETEQGQALVKIISGVDGDQL